VLLSAVPTGLSLPVAPYQALQVAEKLFKRRARLNSLRKSLIFKGYELQTVHKLLSTGSALAAEGKLFLYASCPRSLQRSAN